MVRSKRLPFRTTNEVGGNVSHVGSSDEEDNISDLINDSSQDEDYLPANFYKKSYVNACSDKLKAKRKPPLSSPKQEKLNYGAFRTVLDNSILRCKIHLKNDNSDNYCHLGDVHLNIEVFSDSSVKKGDFFWFYICPADSRSAIYFEWFDDAGSSTSCVSSSRNSKLTANRFKFFYVLDDLNTELWNGLCIQKYFNIFCHKIENNTVHLSVYLLKGGLVNLSFPYMFSTGRKALSNVCHHFFGVEPLRGREEGDRNTNHDIDAFYSSLKEKHDGIKFTDVDVQHPFFIPELRPYQKLAVQWMLHQEKFHKEEFETKLHPLYIEITSLDNKKLYYNQYGNFFVSEKPLQSTPSPGGILADEMGLGKTVEVLACIMCNTRPASVEGDSLDNGENVHREMNLDQLCDKADSNCIKSELNENINSATDDESKMNDVQESCFEKEEVSEDEIQLQGSKNLNDFSEESKSRSAKRKAREMISYSFHDSVLISDAKDDEDYVPETEDSFDDCSMMTVSTDEKSNSRRKRVRKCNYEFNNDFSEPAPKKRKISYDIDKEISDCPIWSSIEKAIIERVWEGSPPKYSKEGSLKEFKNFLRKRKTDPCYMMSLRERLQIQYDNSIQECSSRVSMPVIKGFFDTKVKQKSFFECVCGGDGQITRCKRNVVQCKICSLLQHASCVNFDVVNCEEANYVCPHCWTTQTPLQSGATLIVSPASINHQWLDEIAKHIKKDSLKVYSYDGVSNAGYVQPQVLASYDLVLVTYETLRKELNYVDLPHSNSEEGRRFRFPKRFMATPSPLPCVEWWRICLDEAQMVECVTAKTAEMALRLSAVNRWCITGTPIQKTVDDLQGLLMFLGVDPFCVPQWWQRCLYDPYCRGDTEPLKEVMSKYLWRSSKRDVTSQLDIPPQREEIHWLQFTAVEEHFYHRLHSSCSSDALRRLAKFPDESVKLSSLDRKVLSNLLQPLFKLRQACIHPQIVKGQFTSLNRKTMTMEQLLDSLLKKTQVEVEDSHRVIVASLNGLAAIDIIRGNYSGAVEKYREVLRSAEENKENFKTDSLQKLHTIHNLAEVLQARLEEGIQPTLRDGSLGEEAGAIREEYLKHFPQRRNEIERECEQNVNFVDEEAKKLKCKTDWWILALESQDSEFVQEIREELLSKYGRFHAEKCLLYPVRSRVQLMQLLQLKMKQLRDQRKEMIRSTKKLLEFDPRDLVDGAIDCHLRQTESKPNPCTLCQRHDIFLDYEENLFFMMDAKFSRTTDRSKETKTMKEKLCMLDKTRDGNWGQGDIERVLRFLQTKSLGRVDSDSYEDSQTHFQMIQGMKKEFKNFRILWRSVYDHVSALDEVNMATIRFRVRLPGEEVGVPLNKKKKNKEQQHIEELENKRDAPTYVLEESDIPAQELKLKSEKIVAQNELRMKLGQLYYLKNLKKVDFGDAGNSNPEPCPVCRGKLGHRWKVLLCGHSYCLDCVSVLAKRAPIAINCPICRYSTKIKEIAYVDMLRKEEEQDEEENNDKCVKKVVGSLSTKIEGVVRRISAIKTSDLEAKILIFSSWSDVLEVIADGLAQNGITHRVLSSNHKFQATLSSFKANQEITCLLLPISSGANGLNLIEARHVVLVEPILNPAAEVQAIGRVHRIGQRKETVVHRFLVRSTIEERMFSVLHPKVVRENCATEEKSLTIGELRQLFASPLEEEHDAAGEAVTTMPSSSSSLSPPSSVGLSEEGNFESH